MLFDKKENARKYTLQDGDTLQSIAERETDAGNEMTWQELAKFNWGTDDLDVINEYLRDELGCYRRDDANNFVISNDADARGELLIPVRFEKSGLALNRAHTLRVRRKVSPPQFLECCSISGITFEFDKSFVRPSVVDYLAVLEEVVGRFPDAKIMIFGHTDKSGPDPYNKALSERRARSVYAFITDDADIWEALYNDPQENWGMRIIQLILTDFGGPYDPRRTDGVKDSRTTQAISQYQTDRGLAVDGVAGPDTRREMFTEYMTSKHNVELTPDQFMDPKHMGCGEFNPIDPVDGPHEPNRRVTFYLFHPDRLPNLPCKYGNLSPCRTQMTQPDPRHRPSFRCSFYDSLARRCSCEVGPVKPEEVFLKFYADTDHTGNVEESETEWSLRGTKPGAIVIYNCDRDGATDPNLDFEDNLIVNTSELQDFSKLVIKQNVDLPGDCRAFVILSSADVRKVRGFAVFAAGAYPVIGSVSGGLTTEFELLDIRKRDYTLAFEAVQPVWKSGDETLEIHVVVRRGSSEAFNEFVYFTIAPWLMLSNIEEATEVYVASISSNTAFRAALSREVGPKLRVISDPNPKHKLDRWMQDILEIGFSDTPIFGIRMQQFVNSLNADRSIYRSWTYRRVRKELISGSFGHISFPTLGSRSLDSFGNLEVTPPLKNYPFGRIFYGVRDTSYSDAHFWDEMGASVQNFLKANKYQPPIQIPTNWLTVGHVDEFLSFVPNLKASEGEKNYKLLIASPDEAILLCRKLQADHRGSAMICEGKGSAYSISVDNFLADRAVVGSYPLLNLNNEVQNLLDKILKKIILPDFDLSDPDDIVRIPVIFKGLIIGGKVTNAIANTGGMVNCLVDKPKVIIPKPFGPKDAAGEDVFKKDAEAKLRILGLDPKFVDDWDPYHTKAGEIHCGTNTKRLPPADWEWWDPGLTIGGSNVHT